MTRPAASLAIIGAGRAGSALGRLLARRGWAIAAVASRTLGPARRLARACGSPIATTDPALAARKGSVVLIAVPDREIPGVADRLARAIPVPDPRVYLHTSGASGAEALAALAGRRTGSLHPLASLPPAGPRTFDLRGTSFAVDGGPAARRAAQAIARALGGRVLILPGRGRPAYHLAACLASNYVVTLLAEAVEILAAAGVRRDRALGALLPLVGSTVRNLESARLPFALTGPIARGDAVTLARHAAWLAAHRKGATTLHRALVLRTIRLARSAGWLDRAGAGRLTRALRPGGRSGRSSPR